MESTGMTEAEFTTFYDVNQVNSFSFWLKVDLDDISEHYSCPSSEYNAYSTTNCTAEYIAQGQWGSSMVTNNPILTDETLFPSSTTYNTWNSTIVPEPCEYYYFSRYVSGYGEDHVDTPPLDSWQVANVTGKSYNYFGLDNTFNAKHLYYFYSTMGPENPYDFVHAVCNAWQLSFDELYAMMETLDYQIQEFLLGGIIKATSQKDLVLGYLNPLIEAWNPSDATSYDDEAWKSGDAILYSSAVAPILTGR
jgi:hypothetical protein